ncbi:MAG TPA: FAD-dependent oxidoreductase [Thermoanaerobaculia bacterium]|nr:FAD-dependent oxidoreductase [Thermoanaerobaculia bacterium]
MATELTPPPLLERDFPLGLGNFRYQDLHSEARLAELDALFLSELDREDPPLGARLRAYRAEPASFDPLSRSKLLVDAGRFVGVFVARLFGVEREWQAQIETARPEAVLFRFRRDFLQRRAAKAPLPDLASPAAEEIAEAGRAIERGLHPELPWDRDPELATSLLGTGLIDLEADFLAALKQKKIPEVPGAARERARLLARRASEIPGGLGLPAPGAADEELLAFVEGLLKAYALWTNARRSHPLWRREVKEWASFRLPETLNYSALVETERPSPAMPEERVGPHDRRRRREGFVLTDPRMSARQVLGETHYCLLCHDREKDSCSKGFFDVKTDTFQKNPLGVALPGCPLDEKISEMHALRRDGDAIGALAIVCVDNPMCPGTGHRICNDCMKGCIFQKQDPVNIPQIETGVLTDVLSLPWGVEIYGLLTRWNPLSPARPYALPYNGRKVMIVGLGPAGYTLAHYLLNEGFGVVGVDGLKIEPLPADWTGADGRGIRPIRDWSEVARPLDRRPLAGFGGVSEYGITVRWDKNFLTLVHLTLARRQRFAPFGGVRFGGTITAEQAFEQGFDHVAIAAGAGRPTIIGMKNNLVRGVRKASDFLMALQLTGAFKEEGLANLQAELPAVVIGGGLTAIDTATELLAYYPIQAEKVLARYETLAAERGEQAVRNTFDAEERDLLDRLLQHGTEVRRERERAVAAGERPDFARLCRQWGGVSIVYRRAMEDSPAYRLNHEEIIKAFEEGISFIEGLEPQEAIADARGHLQAVRFRRSGEGDVVELPARSCLVAAGTTPNITYEKEWPGSFRMDERRRFFLPHRAAPDGAGGWVLEPAASDDQGAFFTGYNRGGKLVSFFGDNHPAFNGNVVKAMASAKKGYRPITDALGGPAPGQIGEVAPVSEWNGFRERMDDLLTARVAEVRRLTPTIVEVVVRAPAAAANFQPGQFFRLQNLEAHAPVAGGAPLLIEPLALTGAWVDRERGLLSMIALELGGSSRLCSALRPGEPVLAMGPTGAATELPKGGTVLLCGGGLGNAVLFSIGKKARELGNRVLYFAGYKNADDFYKREEIEAAADVLVLSVDRGRNIPAQRPADREFVGNIIESMLAYAAGKLGPPPIALSEADRIIVIGSDRMMAAVAKARHTVLAPYLKPGHVGIGSINSPMQCMMKEVCAQCLQKHVDPATGREKEIVFSCMNQDQLLDEMDWENLAARLRQNTVSEKLTNMWLDRLLSTAQIPRI